jgi:predicted Zn finger-like uncharacterized protein
MIIRCSECGVQYRIDEGRLSDQSRIFRCGQCGEILRKAPSTPKLPSTPKTATQYLLIRCPDCGTNYRLSAERLTEKTSGLRCRNCGRVISLHRHAPSRSLKVRVIRTDQPESESPATRQPVFHTYSARPNSGKRKLVLLAAASAGLIVLVFTGLFLGYPLLFHSRPPDGSIPETPVQQAPALTNLEKQPLVVLEADLPALRRELQSRRSLITDDPQWRFASAVLDSAGLLRAKLFLFPDPESQLLPVLVLQGKNAADLKEGFLRSNPLEGILLPAEGAAYRFSPHAVKIASAKGFSAESYRVWFHSEWVVFAPLNQSQLWKDGKKRWQSFAVARFSETLENPIRLAGLAIRFPKDLPAGWTHWLIPDSINRNDPIASQRIEAVANFLVLLERSIQQIDTMAGVFRFAGERGRSLEYAQQFRQGIDGNQVFARLQSGKNHPDRPSIGAICSQLLHHDRLTTMVELRDNRLTVHLQWLGEDDQALLKSVLDAVFGPTHSGKRSKP